MAAKGQFQGLEIIILADGNKKKKKGWKAWMFMGTESLLKKLQGWNMLRIFSLLLIVFHIVQTHTMQENKSGTF